MRPGLRLLRVLLLALLPLASSLQQPAFAVEEAEDGFVPVLLAAGAEDLADLSVWLAEYLRTGELGRYPAEGLDASSRAHRELSRALAALRGSQDGVASAQEALDRARSTRALRAADLEGARIRAAQAEAAVQDLILSLAVDASSLPDDATALMLLRERLVSELDERNRIAGEVEAARSRDAAAASHLQRSQEGLISAVDDRSAAASAFSLLLQQLRLAAEGRMELLEGLQSAPSGCPLYAPEGTMRAGPLTTAASSQDRPAPSQPSAPASASRPEVFGGTSGSGLVRVLELCERSAALAPGSEAAAAVRYAFRVLGAPYACDGEGRSQVFRFDCSSFVSRAYWEGAGVPVASSSWAPSTRDMVPWDGHELASWLAPLEPSEALPGDLVLFDMGEVDSRHVVMLLAEGLMVHTSTCEDVLHVTGSWLEDPPQHAVLLGARRVVPEMASGLSSWYGSPLDDVSSDLPAR